jgi:isoleucyl-tRNA synthetase
MKFIQKDRRKANEYERDWAKKWKSDKTFEKSVANRSKSDSYVFYDGPPFITGSPHAGTLISSTVKDAVPRYWTMKGKCVERRWGWDCHGLPAETFTEKKLGLNGKDDVLAYGLEKYVTAARENMVTTGDAWEDTVDRIGRWVDFKNAYKTMDKEYMESIWWAFKELYEKGKIYEGEKVLMYCPQDATPLSKNEVTMDKGAYQDVTDPSVYVKFKLTEKDVYLLAWTTTPWTLLSNTAVAVHPDIDYVEVVVSGSTLILAKDLIEKVLVDEKNRPLEYTVKKEYKGKDLVGKEYEPLFVHRGKNAHKVWAADYVGVDDGTGIVHLAPVYGEEDYELALEKGFPAVHTIDETGHFTEGPWKGEYLWDVNKQIAKDMARYSTKTLMGDYAEKSVQERIAFHGTAEAESDAAILKISYIKHSYPHCHRCDTKLMYRAHPSWFMDVKGQKEEMLSENENINWFPEHIKQGRFRKTIETAPDWNLSRDRFWATPFPVWEGTDQAGQRKRIVVGSYAELAELSGKELNDYHRPWVDDITFEKDGVEYRRIEKVLDCWFESGSMPFAQFHYPFENKEKFEKNFPGDFIVEYVGQVRAWFYYMHTVSVALFGVHSFKNVIVTGNVMGDDGYKLSKSRGNFTDPNEAMDAYSADAYRFVMLSSNLLNGEDYALLDKNIHDVQRKLSMIWNMYDFFMMYAAVDGWDSPKNIIDPTEESENILDRWILSRLHETMVVVDDNMQKYDIPNATRPLLDFLDDASNWYVRRSRKRFWKSESDSDKNQAYRTLHYTLVQIAKMFAPFTPFLAEELYVSITGEESVHLTDWTEPGKIDNSVLGKMHVAREMINEGLAFRATHKVKVRQPLASVFVSSHIDEDYQEIVKEELNVKEYIVDPQKGLTTSLDLKITDVLKIEGEAREIIRFIQQARKKAGFDVDDRIIVSYVGCVDVFEHHADLIAHEVLADAMHERSADESGYIQEVQIGERDLCIGLVCVR